MSNLNVKLLLSGFLIALAVDTAIGQVDIVFSDGTTIGSTFNVNVGDTQTISVIAAETQAGTDLSTIGINGFGFLLDADPTSGTASVITGFTANPDLDGALGRIDIVAEDSVQERRTNFVNVPGTSVLLGDLDISVTEPGTTLFTLADFSAAGEFGTSGGDSLDADIFQGGRTFSFVVNGVSAIPEPSGSVLIGLSMLASMIRRKRRCS
ncbi:PEP-CTERM sorting domain-containing protein [Mariniblastus sp.]|nr:PEP-CTERM sorting domain-containing protein [Mariniblastus sp.]